MTAQSSLNRAQLTTSTINHGVDAAGWPLAEVITRLRRALRSSVRSEFAWERLPMAQVELLQRLSDEPGLRVKDLAERHRLATNTVSNLVQQMVQADLVERRPDPHDRRAVVVQLTARGEQLLHAWLAANSRRLQAALQGLPARDRAAIVGIVPALTRLVEQLEQADAAHIDVEHTDVEHTDAAATTPARAPSGARHD